MVFVQLVSATSSRGSLVGRLQCHKPIRALGRTFIADAEGDVRGHQQMVGLVSTHVSSHEVKNFHSGEFSVKPQRPVVRICWLLDVSRFSCNFPCSV